MRTVDYILPAIGAVVLAAIAVAIILHLAAHVHRYRSYRRQYPSADRGRVWRYTR